MDEWHLENFLFIYWWMFVVNNFKPSIPIASIIGHVFFWYSSKRKWWGLVWWSSSFWIVCVPIPSPSPVDSPPRDTLSASWGQSLYWTSLVSSNPSLKNQTMCSILEEICGYSKCCEMKTIVTFVLLYFYYYILLYLEACTYFVMFVAGQWPTCKDTGESWLKTWRRPNILIWAQKKPSFMWSQHYRLVGGCQLW